jgi:hypothetical protein
MPQPGRHLVGLTRGQPYLELALQHARRVSVARRRTHYRQHRQTP